MDLTSLPTPIPPVVFELAKNFKLEHYDTFGNFAFQKLLDATRQFLASIKVDTLTQVNSNHAPAISKFLSRTEELQKDLLNTIFAIDVVCTRLRAQLLDLKELLVTHNRGTAIVQQEHDLTENALRYLTDRQQFLIHDYMAIHNLHSFTSVATPQ